MKKWNKSVNLYSGDNKTRSGTIDVSITEEAFERLKRDIGTTLTEKDALGMLNIGEYVHISPEITTESKSKPQYYAAHVLLAPDDVFYTGSEGIHIHIFPEQYSGNHNLHSKTFLWLDQLEEIFNSKLTQEATIKSPSSLEVTAKDQISSALGNEDLSFDTPAVTTVKK